MAMKPVTTHHILIFLHCTKMPKIEHSKTPRGCPWCTIFLTFWTPNKKKCEFKWSHHIAHLLWYSQPCWRTQDFLMKPVTIHHILIFSFYIALKCQKLKIPKPHLNNPPRCPCRTHFFLTFGHRTGKKREFKWLRHIAHLLWYSQPCWRTQDFLMKPVTIHHILIFFFLHCTKMPKIEHSKTPPKQPP